MSKKQYFDFLMQTKDGLKVTKAKVYGKDKRLLVEKSKYGYALLDRATCLTLTLIFYPYLHDIRPHMRNITCTLDYNSIDVVYDKYLKEKYEKRIKQKDYATWCLEYQKLVKKYMERLTKICEM